MIIASIAILPLCFAPPQNAVSELEAAADAIADQSPAESIARLEAALTEAQRQPRELLTDPSATETLARARLALVWAQLANDDLAAATATMDTAIRSAGATPLPLSGLGPAVSDLHDQRRALLEAAGHATIAVDCDGCEVLIDEGRADNPSAPLLLGSHRVWLLDPSGELEPRFADVVLDADGAIVSLDYRPTVTLPPKPKPPPPVAPDKPVVPRWAKIVGMSVGAGLLVTGGVLLSREGKCQGGGAPSPDNTDTCPEIWSMAAPSYALLGIGSGLLLGGGVWLTIDELRASKRKASAQASVMIGWTMRF